MVWWRVDLGRVYNIYSINILFKNYEGYVDRQRGRFAGFSLHVSNYDVSSIADIKASTLCYKDGPQLPPLNFTEICSVKGRYVIYYNERLNGVIYPEGYEVLNINTELCEVIVQGCKNTSLFGSNCDTPCPTNCKDSTCHIQSGVCSSCKPGWTGTYCNTTCGEGWYGVNCSQHCEGHCKDDMKCNHVTGQCDEGCATGWTGATCNKECSDGTYGYNCVNKCSGHCLYDSPCNKQTGHCDKGCSPGYTTDSACSKECPAGQFGFGCIKRCSEHCLIKDLCDHVSGECTNGCLDGFVGTHCNNSCLKGYFGTNCSQVCLPNCKPDTCRHTDGWCICAAGLTAKNCITENLLRKKNTSNSSMLVIGLSVSILINLIFIVCGSLICRGFATNRVTFTGSLLSCREKSVYQNSVVKSDETTTYQELYISDNTYQNTTIL